MNKEVAIAIVIGLFFGIFAALAILFAPQIFSNFGKKIPTLLSPKNKNEIIKKEKEKNKKKDTLQDTKKAQELIIKNPKEREIFTKSPITIKGAAAPNNLIVVLSVLSQRTTTSNDKGEFSTKIELAEGRNELQIVAYNKNGDKEPQVAKITVYYYAK